MSISMRWSGSLLGAGALVVLLGPSHTAMGCSLPPMPGASAPSVVLRIDPARSRVQFEAKAFLHDFSGSTSTLEGTIRAADQERLSDAEACISIDAGSLRTGIGARDTIMRDDHLETPRFPTIDFYLTRVEGAQPVTGGWEFTARGLLTLHGVAREILLPIRARRDGEGVRLLGEVPIRMSDYRIPIPKLLFLAVEDQVLVRFDVTATRAP